MNRAFFLEGKGICTLTISYRAICSLLGLNGTSFQLTKSRMWNMSGERNVVRYDRLRIFPSGSERDSVDLSGQSAIVVSNVTREGSREVARHNPGGLIMIRSVTRFRNKSQYVLCLSLRCILAGRVGWSSPDHHGFGPR